MRKLHVAGLIALLLSLALVARAVDLTLVGAALAAAFHDPMGVALAAALYLGAFLIRAGVWCRVLPGLGFGHAVAALHVSLAANHILPLRLGEALRVTSVVRRAGLTVSAATASTLMLRAADILAVLGLAGIFGSRLGIPAGPWTWVATAAVAIGWAVGVAWTRNLRRNQGIVTRAAVAEITLGATAAWLLESVVIWKAADWAGIPLSPGEAVLVTAVTIAAQALAVTPGGIGTYEAAATAAMVAAGAAAGPALAAAVTAHALKTTYSLISGAFAAFVPGPTEFGRLRLPDRTAAEFHGGAPPRAGAPIVLFFPAHNEEESVADVLRRVPRRVCGHEVIAFVVDDGSTDETAAVVEGAGARVVRHELNRGLGAAVRTGLAEGLQLDPAAIAFCDADGEYAPEELERMVEPILSDEADYVVGSRFGGTIERMLPHRRLGNIVLTRATSFVARRRLSDAQSGYRAFSRWAAESAEVIHDFNYAQVMTLDLLAKGFRLVEVPITYSFRRQGKSFVKLPRYLRHVMPAVHRELNEHRA